MYVPRVMSDSKHNHEKTRLLMRKRKCVHLSSNSPFMSRNAYNGGSGKKSPERWQKFNRQVNVNCPRVVGPGIPGEFDCTVFPFPWVGNNKMKGLMEHKIFEGGGVWQDLSSAWKLASTCHLENITQISLGLLFCACLPF